MIGMVRESADRFFRQGGPLPESLSATGRRAIELGTSGKSGLS
jgi:hypothetical protein